MPPSAAAAYQSLQAKQKNRLRPEQAIAQGEARYGIQGLGSQVDALRSMTRNLETSIRNVDPSVAGRTAGSLVTQAARDRIVNNERTPLMEQYGTASRSLSDAGEQYNRVTGLASNYASSLLADDENEYNRLFGQYQTLAGQESEAAKMAEQRRQFDAQLAESRRAAAASAGAGLRIPAPARAATPKTPDPVTLALGAAQTARDQLRRIEGGPAPFARERILESIRRQFPQVPANVIQDIIYKQVFPDGWDGSVSTVPQNQQRALMSAVGY